MGRDGRLSPSLLSHAFSSSALFRLRCRSDVCMLYKQTRNWCEGPGNGRTGWQERQRGGIEPEGCAVPCSAYAHAAPQRARHAHGGPAHALAPARRSQRALQDARPQRHLHHRDCRRGGCLSEPGHLLFPHQGGAVRRGRLPRHAAHRRAGRDGGSSCAHAEGLRGCAGRQRHGCRRPALVHRGADADTAAARPRAAGRAHHRAAQCRGRARLCGRDGAPRLAFAQPCRGFRP